MKLLHLADLHIGKQLSGYSLIEDQRATLAKIAAYTQENGVDAIIIAGDVYDRSTPSADSIELLDSFLYHVTAQLGKKVFIIAGNHDSPRRISFANKLYASSGLFVEGVFATEIKKITLNDEHGPVNFFLLPYFDIADLRNAFPDSDFENLNEGFRFLLESNAERFNFEERNILVAHGFFSAMGKPVETSDSEHAVGGLGIIDLSPAKSFDYIALGHLHIPQAAGLANARYSGSLLKYSVSEHRSQKSMSIVELGEKGEVAISTESIVPPRDLKILIGSFEELTMNTAAQTDDYYSIELTDDGVIYDVFTRLKDYYPNIIELKPRVFRQSESCDIEAVKANHKLDDIELFKKFHAEIIGEEITQEREKIVCDTFEELRRKERETALA